MKPTKPQAIGTIQDDFDKILVITHLDELKNAFPIRIEVTKRPVEGSTFEIVVLYWAGMEKMRNSFEHARAVYVAATRPSRYLAIVE